MVSLNESFINIFLQTFRILKNRRSLGVHMATHNDPTVVCEQCGKLFKSKRRLRQHKKIMHKVIHNVFGLA